MRLRRIALLALAVCVLLAGCTNAPQPPSSSTTPSSATSTAPSSTTPASTPTPSTTPAPRFVHWHATFAVYVNDTRVVFNPNAPGGIRLFYEGGANYLPAHLHQCNPNLIHNEAREGQGSLAALFNVAWSREGGNLTADRLVVPAGASLPGTYVADASHPLRLYVSENNTAWRGPVDVDAPLQDHMRYLLVHGNDTDGQVQAYEDAMPLFDTRAVC